MDHDRRADAEPHDCRGHEQGDDAEADDQILADDPTRTAAQSHSERQVRQIIGHQRDIGSLKRDVRSGSTHRDARSEEHTSELQSLMRISSAAFCLKKKTSQDYITLNIDNIKHQLNVSA